MSTLEKKLYTQIQVNSQNSFSNVKFDSPTYKGFSTVANDSHSSRLFDIALIKQDIINHFHIRKGEKLSDPNFGTIIWDILFEPLTDQIKNIIIQDVSDIINYDPRVQVNEILVDQYETGLIISCELVYLPYTITEKLRLRFDEDNGFVTGE